ncbi:unnamed protein product, partial [Arctogadus glacialis]
QDADDYHKPRGPLPVTMTRPKTDQPLPFSPPLRDSNPPPPQTNPRQKTRTRALTRPNPDRVESLSGTRRIGIDEQQEKIEHHPKMVKITRTV